METSQFQPIREASRSRNGGTRVESCIRRSASLKYSSGELPPSSSSRSHRSTARAGEVMSSNGRRRYSGSYDDNTTSNSSLSGSATNNDQINPKDGGVNQHHYNSRLSKVRNSVEEDSDHRPLLYRRSSSAMRVRELRDVLTSMTSSQDQEEAQEMKGSQKARLLVASQQRLVSRLQDLGQQLDSIDNEVTRVKGDIISSRRYFSAMTGIPYGPEWPTTRQMDSAYTSPTSYLSPGSSEGSPCPSETDWPSAPALAATSSPAPGKDGHSRDSGRSRHGYCLVSPETDAEHHYDARQTCPKTAMQPSVSKSSGSGAMSNSRLAPHGSLHPDHAKRRYSDQINHGCTSSHIQDRDERRGSGGDRHAHLESPFRSLADFDDVRQGEGREGSGSLNGGPLLTRSDSCSSFMSWRSDQEMASLFPEEADTEPADICPRYGFK